MFPGCVSGNSLTSSVGCFGNLEGPQKNEANALFLLPGTSGKHGLSCQSPLNVTAGFVMLFPDLSKFSLK